MKKILGLVALVATLGLASCQKNEGPAIQQNQKSVTIDLTNIMTRAMEAGVTDGTQVNLKNVNIFFKKTDGTFAWGKDVSGEKILDHYLSKSDLDAVADPVTKSDVIVFHYLPAEVDKVVVVGNLNADKTGTDGGELTKDQTPTCAYANYNALVTQTTTILAETGVDDLILFGEATPVETTTELENGHTLWEANVNVVPVVSRIEIIGFKYNPEGGEYVADTEGATVETSYDYTSITVDQVTLNDYYTTSTIYQPKATLTGATQFAEITDVNVFDFLQSAEPTNETTYAPTFTDMLTNVDLKEAGEYKYDYTGNRPSYNFFPMSDQAPQLVVKLTGVNAKTGLSEALYLATSDITYNNASIKGNTPSGNDIDYAQVYQLSFNFNDTDLKNPLKCIQVNVTVASWKVVSVTPSFGN